jgi:HK97 family phage major capsid protein
MGREMQRFAGEVKGQVSDIETRLLEMEQKSARRGGGGTPDHTPGHKVTNSDGFKSFGGPNNRGKFRVEIKSITSGTGSAGALVSPDRQTDPVLMAQRRLTVRDLITGGQTTSNMVEFARQTVRTNNAAVVSEGVRKPESNIAFEIEQAPVRTIAHFMKASKQVLADAPVLQATIDSELMYGLKLKEEDELLFGSGQGQHLEGIAIQATAFSAPYIISGATRFDVLLQAIAQTEQALLPATGIVMNDIDLTQLRHIKDDNGNYITSGGPFGPPITSIWGRPVVGTPAMGSGHFLVGAFRDGAQVLDSWEAQILVSTENEDDFVKNLCTILCEERLALAVKRPQAFVYGEFGD